MQLEKEREGHTKQSEKRLMKPKQNSGLKVGEAENIQGLGIKPENVNDIILLLDMNTLNIRFAKQNEDACWKFCSLKVQT